MNLHDEVEELWMEDKHVALARRCVEQQQLVARNLDAIDARRLLKTMREK
ncbi:hypothetical protein [Paraburkholderia azotifigens]|uniref:Uncharacterized protein n=1 Tax=Paraburkholderia azotifigens TaxID=2057004 RepID=A0ABU9R2W8_9BURK